MVMGADYCCASTAPRQWLPGTASRSIRVTRGSNSVPAGRTTSFISTARRSRCRSRLLPSSSPAPSVQWPNRAAFFRPLRNLRGSNKPLSIDRDIYRASSSIFWARECSFLAPFLPRPAFFRGGPRITPPEIDRHCSGEA